MNRLRFSRTVYLSNGGFADRHHAFDAWDKPKGAALVFQFEISSAEHWIFQMLNIIKDFLHLRTSGRLHQHEPHRAGAGRGLHESSSLRKTQASAATGSTAPSMSMAP
jgi:hypothetical protein